MMSIMPARLRTMASHFEKRFYIVLINYGISVPISKCWMLASHGDTTKNKLHRDNNKICMCGEKERERLREMELKYKNNQKRYKVLFHGPWNVSYKRRNYSRNHCVAHFDSNFGDIFDAVNKGHFPKLQCKSTWTAWIFMLLNATFW